MVTHTLEPKYGRRFKTIYDAAAGRVRAFNPGAITTTVDDGLRRAVAPDDMILDLKSIKTSGEGYPIVDHPDLPSDEFVAALHYYASQYFRRFRPELMESLEDDLLLSIAIIMEEEIKKLIGPNGHLAYAKDKDLSDPEGESAYGWYTENGSQPEVGASGDTPEVEQNDISD